MEKIFDKVLVRLEEKDEKKRFPKKFTAVLIAALIAVIAAGSVVATKVVPKLITVRQEIIKVSMDGRIFTDIVEYETYDIPPEGGFPVDYDEEWLVKNSSYTTLTVYFEESGGGAYGLTDRIEGDYDELLTLISDSSVMAIPHYVTENFEFTGAYFGLYITEETLNEAVKLTEFFGDDGKLYQSFLLPDSAKDDIDFLYLTYKNSNGEEIYYDFNLGSYYASASINAKITTPEIEGFDNAVCIIDTDITRCYGKKFIDKVYYYDCFEIGGAERYNKYGFRFHSGKPLDYISYTCSVSSETLPTEELIKMLESVS